MTDVRRILLDLPRNDAQAHFSERAATAYLGNGQLLCRVLGDFKMVMLGSYLGMTPHLAFDGYWEWWLSHYFADAIQPGDHVLDVGANHGYFSVLANALSGPSGKLTAYEPNPDVFECLRKNMNLNGYTSRTTLHNAGLGTRTGELAPYLRHRDEPMNGRFLEPGDSREDARASGEILDLPIHRPDPGDYERLDFVKIDVEGAELDVLDALSPLLDVHDPHVVCEVNFARGYTLDAVETRLKASHDLLFLDVDAALYPLTQDVVDRRGSEDLLAVRVRMP